MVSFLIANGYGDLSPDTPAYKLFINPGIFIGVGVRFYSLRDWHVVP